MEIIEREISRVILKAIEYYSVICVTGPRQSGKSTLIKHLFSDYDIFSLEDLDVRNYAENDPVGFLNQTENGIILDEVQRVPSLFSYIQGIVDNNPKRKFILSGSSNFQVMKNITQSLAGRVALFELLPMSYNEAADIYTKDTSLDEILFNGLYPAVCAKKNIPEMLYPFYVKTYLEKDVRELLQVKDIMQFNTFLKLCAGRIGSVFNASQLANEVGVTANTITSWLSILQTSYIVYLLPPYHDNFGKRLIKSPKLYFCDTGLACYLLNIETTSQLSRDKLRGALFENFVVSEFIKHRLNQGKEPHLYFYRDSNQNEIDLLSLEEGELSAFEIKSSMTYNSVFEKTLKKTAFLIKQPVSHKTVIYAGTMENTVSDIKLINYKHLF
ncbi:MAG: ATP-binding protein [Bacteroidales bacterium]|nr:ATP-binding protein [Bacteroidales bacterium]